MKLQYFILELKNGGKCLIEATGLKEAGKEARLAFADKVKMVYPLEEGIKTDFSSYLFGA